MPRNAQGLVRLVQRDGASERTVDAFRKVRREDFVPKNARANAYGDRPVMIPEHQTTSQPSLIARMIDAAEVEPTDVVLEVGTGYGFQTALLAQLCRRVFSIERYKQLAEAARLNLKAVGIDNATVVVGDGWEGLPEQAPFDAIVVSAAATHVPPALVEQLNVGGRMVIPVKGRLGDEVTLFRKTEHGLSRERLVTPARFVPLVPGTPAGGTGEGAGRDD
jgi:protein-L-isoaspartate(D-aspartate) O-methyltransferase